MAVRRTAKIGIAELTAAMRVVVLYGGETFLIREQFDRLRSALEAVHGPIEPMYFDGKTCALSDVLDELRTLGLMSPHSLVVVDDADQFVKEDRGFRDAVTRYVENPCPTGTLVLRASQWHKGNLDKAIAKVGTVMKCEPMNHAGAASWTAARAKDHHQSRIEPKAAALLVERVGSSLGLLDAELGKLAVMAEPGKPIDVALVEQAVGRGSDEEVWALQMAVIESIATKQTGVSVGKLHEVIELAGHAKELVSWAVLDLCRKLHHAAVLTGMGQNDFAIGKALRIWPADRVKPLAELARTLGPRRAGALFDEAMAADRRAKSGYGDLYRNLEGFCVRATDGR